MTDKPLEILPVDASANPLERANIDVPKLLKFWHQDVLGRPMPKEEITKGMVSNGQILKHLESSFKERLAELLNEVGIPVIDGDVSLLPISTIREHFRELFLDDNHILSDEDKRMFLGDFAQNDQMEKTIGEMVDGAEKERAVLELQSKKQREYLFLKGRQIQSLPSNISIFDFLPKVATDATTRSVNCSLATALGMEIAERAGIEIDYASTPHHVVFVAHTKNGEYRGFDFHNSSPQWRLRLEEKSYEGEDRFVLIDDPHNRFIDFRLIIRRPKEDRVRSVIGNMNYFLNLDEGRLEALLRKSSNNPQRDREMIEHFKKYGTDYFSEVEKHLFGPTPAHVFSKEWTDEVKRLEGI